MSWCRWSTDDFDCDFYIYDHYAGMTVVHVASNRPIIDRESLGPFPDSADENFVTLYLERVKAVSELLKDCDSVDLDGPLTERYYEFDTPADCADWLENVVKPMNYYHFPDNLIEAMREDDG